MHAELTLENSKVQKGLYEQLLEDKQQKVVLLMEERDVLKFEKERLESQLDEMRYELQTVKLENTATNTTNTPVINTTVADNMASSRRKLLKLPVTTAPVHDLKSESCHIAQNGAQHFGERSGDDLLPSVSAVNSEISGGSVFRPVNSQPLFVSSGPWFGTVASQPLSSLFTVTPAPMCFTATSLHPPSLSTAFPIVTTFAGPAPTVTSTVTCISSGIFITALNSVSSTTITGISSVRSQYSV